MRGLGVPPGTPPGSPQTPSGPPPDPPRTPAGLAVALGDAGQQRGPGAAAGAGQEQGPHGPGGVQPVTAALAQRPHVRLLGGHRGDTGGHGDRGTPLGTPRPPAPCPEPCGCGSWGGNKRVRGSHAAPPSPPYLGADGGAGAAPPRAVGDTDAPQDTRALGDGPERREEPARPGGLLCRVGGPGVSGGGFLDRPSRGSPGAGSHLATRPGTRGSSSRAPAPAPRPAGIPRLSPCPRGPPPRPPEPSGAPRSPPPPGR